MRSTCGSSARSARRRLRSCSRSNAARATVTTLRCAIVSDIHGNVRGLGACLADLKAQGGADLIVGAGDYCMDGPRPREVLERLKEAGAACVRGNTDRY